MPSLYVEIIDEPFQSRAVAYKKKTHDAYEAWGVWAKAQGGTGIVFGDPVLWAIEINTQKAPVGWVRVKHSKYHLFRPKKKTPLFDEMKALPRMGSYDEVFTEEEIPTNISYRTPDRSMVGGRNMGGFPPISIGWMGEIYTAVLPDIKATILYYRGLHPEHPDLIINHDLEKWELPPGLKVLTEAEYKLLWAQYQVDLEREKNP